METVNPLCDWIVRRPALFTGQGNIVARAPFSSETACTRAPEATHPRLGFLYQEWCKQLFIASPDYELLGDEIQLSDNGRTLGAIDFVVRNLTTGQAEHWEVAIKFYLLCDGRWYGPNAKDRLDIKLERMLSHQLAMSDSAPFRAQYPWNVDKRRLLMQGRLCINPFEEQAVPTECLGYKLNPDCVDGFWCYYSQLNKAPAELWPLAKPDWPAGLTAFDNSEPLSWQERPLHCQDRQGRFWFIVPDSWPGQ